MALSATAKIAVFILTIASLVLTIFVYADRQVFLLKVSPSINPATGKVQVNGPTVIINAFGSCSRGSNASTHFVCVENSYPAKIDLSALPSNVADGILVPPPFFTALLWVALFFWTLGVVSVYLSSIYVPEGIHKDFLVWIKIMSQIGLSIGFGIWLAQFVFYLKAAADFNASLALQGGNNALEMSAQAGTLSGFLLIGLAYVFSLALYVLTS